MKPTGNIISRLFAYTKTLPNNHQKTSIRLKVDVIYSVKVGQ